MKVIGLKIQNTFNLRAVRLKLNEDGKAIIIRGKNGAGKSAILDSIFYALTGKKPDQVITNGEHRSDIMVDLGEIVVKRTTTEKTMRVIVSSKDGAQFKSPQEMLNKLIGQNSLAFDPLLFARMKEKDQRAVLMQIAQLDFSKFDKKAEGNYAERTVIQRQARSLEGALRELDEPEAGLPAEPVDLTTIEQEADENNTRLAEAHSRDQTIAMLKERWNDKTEQINTMAGQMANLQNTMEKTKASMKEIREEHQQLIEQVAETNIEELQVHNEALHGKYREQQEQNQQIQEAQAYRSMEKDMRDKATQAATLTDDLTAIKNTKLKRIAAAKFPIAGLTVDDERAYYKGIPLAQRSTGELTRIGMAIACSQKPELRIVFIRNASILDEEGLAAVQKYAAAEDYQLVLEMVGDGKEAKSEIYIEAGEIKE